MGKLLIIAVTAATVGCSGRVEKDERPAFTIDSSQAFRLEFGRGSGWHGLDTVRVDQDGGVVLHRRQQADVWETTTLQLPPNALADVLKAVESNGLMGLHREYHADIHDGTQWVLWIKQGEQEKSVYFNNSFPRQITRFAEQLDSILSTAGQDEAAWQPVAVSESRQHERELWDSIKR